MLKKLFCKIRKDITDGVPIWIDGKELYLWNKKKIQYRWLEDTDGFQVKHKGRWYNAYSIDFEFKD